MNRQRAHVALGLALAAVVGSLVVALAGFWLAARAGSPVQPIVTRVDQVGDRVAVVQIDGVGADDAARATRASALRWVVAAMGVALVPIAGSAWAASGWLLRRRQPAEPVSSELVPPAEAGASDAEAERERRRHLQDVVHELRTPLAVTATNLDLASTKPGLDADLVARLAAARRGVERMARTVDDLSAHGRLAPAAHHGLVDLRGAIEALAAEQSGPARLRGLSLVVDGPDRLELAADESAVFTAVGNLLVNAVRLAPAGSAIDLSFGSYEDWCWIAVRDEGPGLAPEDHDRVFRRYWRGRYETDRDPDRATESGRTGMQHRNGGLGLTIARQATEAQGGHVTVRSDFGVGSTFVVWLPRTADARSERVVHDDGIHHRIDPFGERVRVP